LLLYMIVADCWQAVGFSARCGHRRLRRSVVVISKPIYNFVSDHGGGLVRRTMTQRRAWRLAVAVAAVAAAPMAVVAQSAGATRALAPLVETYCSSCHNAEDWAGGLAFDTLDPGHVGQDAAVWEKTVGKLRGRLMPPAGVKQPSQREVDAAVRFLETSLDAAPTSRQVGHVPIQRLNRIEFAATIRSLIGVDIDARQALPSEVEIHGFSNIAQALAVSPAFMEQYLSATRKAVRLAIGEPVPKMAKVFLPAA